MSKTLSKLPTKILSQMLSRDLVAGNRVEESFPGRTSNVCSGQVRAASAVRVRRSLIRQIGNQRDVVLMTLQRSQAFRQPDLRKPPSHFRIERFLSESKTATQENHPFGRGPSVALALGKSLQKWNGEAKTTRS